MMPEFARIASAIEHAHPIRQNVAEALATFVSVVYHACDNLRDKRDPIVREIAAPLIRDLIAAHGVVYGAVQRQNLSISLREFDDLENVVASSLRKALDENPDGGTLAHCFDTALALRKLDDASVRSLAVHALKLVSAHDRDILSGAGGDEAAPVEGDALPAACRFLCARGTAEELTAVSASVRGALRTLGSDMPQKSFTFLTSLAAILEGRGLGAQRDELLRSAWRYCMDDEEVDLYAWHPYLREGLKGPGAQRLAQALLPEASDVNVMLHRVGIPHDVQQLLIANIPQDKLKAALEMLPDRDPAGLAVSAKTFRESGLADAALAIGSRAQRYMKARLEFYEARREGEEHLQLKRPGNAAVTAPNHYMVLGVPRGASPEVIATSLAILQVIFHPDWFRDQPEKKGDAESLIKSATKAHDVLITPATLKQYEALLSYGLGIVRTGPPFFPKVPWFSSVVAEGLFDMEEIKAAPAAKPAERRVLGT
jgi:hypothetical protein